MKYLYIVGNGFDCYSHMDIDGNYMRTRYSDFRDYIISKFPDITYNNGVPETGITYDGDYDYDNDEVAGYIVQVLDQCQGDKWSILEESLGDLIFSEFSWNFSDEDFEDEDDNEIFRSIDNNQMIGENIANTFVYLKKWFGEWVEYELGGIQYDKIISPKGFKKILKGNPIIDYLAKRKRIYINFNYTNTLENVYKISFSKVFHLHGKVGDSSDKIMFGHGNNDKEFQTYGTWGGEDSLNELRLSFVKDTERVLCEYSTLFESLSDVEKIYSYGFSFGEVDMVYIHEICKNIDPHNVTWYFNSYDAERNKQYLRKIEELGFRVKIEYGWDKQNSVRGKIGEEVR